MSLKKLQHDKSIETSLNKEMKNFKLNKDENIINSIGLGASIYVCVCVHNIFFWNTTTNPTWEDLGTPTSSSLTLLYEQSLSIEELQLYWKPIS